MCWIFAPAWLTPRIINCFLNLMRWIFNVFSSLCAEFLNVLTTSCGDFLAICSSLRAEFLATLLSLCAEILVVWKLIHQNSSYSPKFMRRIFGRLAEFMRCCPKLMPWILAPIKLFVVTFNMHYYSYTKQLISFALIIIHKNAPPPL